MPYMQAVLDGNPWLDYKKAEKTKYEQFFVFTIENFLYLVLRDICITYPCVPIKGNARLPLKVTAQLSSTTHQFSPIPIPANLFSSPSQNFNLGVLNEEAQGMRVAPVTFNYPCDKGDTITIIVSGDAGTAQVPLVIGCMITGRKRERERGGKSWR